METDLGHRIKQAYPEVEVREEVFTNTHYWIDVRLREKQWIVIEAFTNGGFGVSSVSGEGLDFCGHDELKKHHADVIDYVAAKLNALHGQSDLMATRSLPSTPWFKFSLSGMLWLVAVLAVGAAIVKFLLADATTEEYMIIAGMFGGLFILPPLFTWFGLKAMLRKMGQSIDLSPWEVRVMAVPPLVHLAAFLSAHTAFGTPKGMGNLTLEPLLLGLTYSVLFCARFAVGVIRPQYSRHLGTVVVPACACVVAIGLGFFFPATTE